MLKLIENVLWYNMSFHLPSGSWYECGLQNCLTRDTSTN